MPYKAGLIKPRGWQPRPISPKLRGYDREHRAWRRLILERDPICKLCGKQPSSHADHIQSIKDRPELRLSLGNGRGLCPSCHSAVTAKYDGGFGNARKNK